MEASISVELTYEDLFGEDNFEIINRKENKNKNKDTDCVWINCSSELD